MAIRTVSKLNPKKKYLQVALNSTLGEARKIINSLPVSDRIIIEAGTPLIKRYGEGWCRPSGPGQLLPETHGVGFGASGADGRVGS